MSFKKEFFDKFLNFFYQTVFRSNQVKCDQANVTKSLG